MLGTTHTWRVGESSMSRLSFNALVSRKAYDMPEDMWKSEYMGRQATMGPKYIQNGVMSRVVVGSLDATRPDTYHPCISPMARSGSTIFQRTNKAFTESGWGTDTRRGFGMTGMTRSPPGSAGSNNSRSSSRSLARSASLPML
eukprot:TRINITY_DN85704_c0_g1_i1.p1 TRINITY_DN85704_c0_g1~~TRINITY_DN85704_c0_g1_i1.p1  ORF type:complete len:143 (+),score=0.51 TRINITY_DN85704_c0_g1_i1:68-496(+)